MISDQLHVEIANLTSREYRYSPKLGDFLGSFIKAAMRAHHMSEASVLLRDHGSLRGARRAGEIHVDDFTSEPHVDHYENRSPADEIAAQETHFHDDYSEEAAEDESPGFLNIPIIYKEEEIGHLCSRPGKRTPKKEHQDFLNLVARRLAFMIKRHEASQWSRRCLGRHLPLVGGSAPLTRVDEFIEKASRVDLPVIITGETGTETARVACALHAAGPRCEEHFLEINCAAIYGVAALREQLGPILGKNPPGTLFLNSIDRLNLESQTELLAFLDSRVGQWIGGTRDASPRIIVSSYQNLGDLMQEGHFSAELLMELDFLRITLPSLRERREDIGPLIHYVFEKHRRHPRQRIAEDALRMLEEYDWPQNLFEIERVIARLAAMAEEPEWDVSLLRRYAPVVIASVSESTSQASEVELPSQSAPKEHSLVSLARAMLDKDFSATVGLHISLQRALRYIRQHFLEDMVLSELAENAFVSPSHLSYLFKSELGTSFKTLLACLRIEKAKRLLCRDKDARITDICLESGFGDLSHFEKTFKKWVGCKPKDFRRQGE